MAASIRNSASRCPSWRYRTAQLSTALATQGCSELKIETVPVILCDEWTPAQVKAFRLMANKSVAWAEWDTELLRLEMED